MGELNQTIVKFEYPRSLIHEYENWLILLRPSQLTAGSLILVHKGMETSLAELPVRAFMELKTITQDIEAALRINLAPDQINYLALMMVDRHVHFHVFPRYRSEKVLGGETFIDSGWPGPPDFSQQRRLGKKWFEAIVTDLKHVWFTA